MASGSGGAGGAVLPAEGTRSGGHVPSQARQSAHYICQTHHIHRPPQAGTNGPCGRLHTVIEVWFFHFYKYSTSIYRYISLHCLF